MAKEEKTIKQNPVKPKASKGRGFLDSVLILVAIVALFGGIFVFYYFEKQWQPLARFGVIAGGVVAFFGLLALTNFGRMAWQYIRGSRIELRKITWPTRPELWQTTLAVVVVVSIMALILGVFDYGVNQLFDAFIYEG